MQSAVDPVQGLPGRSDRPTLKLIKAVCDEFYEPILRREEREDSENTARLCLPPPRHVRTPEEQAAIDKQVEAVCKLFGISTDGLRDDKFIPKPSDDLSYYATISYSRNDGKHGERVMADLAKRRRA